MMAHRAPHLGFSLIELLASLAIMALLASAAMPLAQNTMRRERELELRRALREMRQAIDAYKAATLDGRIASTADESGYPPDLSTLANGVENAQKPGAGKLYFLRQIPRDPFYPDPTTPAAETWGIRSFDSPPDAPQRGADVFDVYSQSEQSGLDGIAYRAW